MSSSALPWSGRISAGFCGEKTGGGIGVDRPAGRISDLAAFFQISAADRLDVFSALMIRAMDFEVRPWQEHQKPVARAHEFGWLLCDIGNLMLLSCCL
jgi:hypothetical protein